MPPPWVWIVLAVNVVAFLAMGYDKWCAGRGRSRVSERSLLLLAVGTGAPGIWLGRAVFRHKTRKQSFIWKLVLATGLLLAWIGVALKLFAASSESGVIG